MSGPGTIRKLSDDVVNRIAAGEIVQRPANALKELIENSLDAKSTSIVITVKAGGLKFLQIQDNGSGIRHDNLDIVCERFTTSKLEEYEDLRSITTYGFRGEALASISHIAHLTIMTKTASDKCAYKASYEDGKLKGPIKPCAGNNGTQITVEDLFYNVIARKKALRSPSEEYNHILEVVSSYAIHNSKVGFTLKKFGENTDLKTPVNSNVIENIRIILGNQIARELTPIEIKDATLKLDIQGVITNVNYSHKKGQTLLFINHRLVDSTSIRRAVDAVYSTYLPKNGHPFVYLSIELDPRNVDVNVHPTKHEVQFLYEEQIVEKIKSCVESKLLSCNSTRVMYTQARLPGASMVEEIVKKTTDGAKVNPNSMVRVNADMQKIDKFFHSMSRPPETRATDQSTEEKTYLSPRKQNLVYDDNVEEDTVPDRQKSKTVEISDEGIEDEPEIRRLETKDVETDIVLENSIVEEPIEKIKQVQNDRWKQYTSNNNDAAVYIDPKESFKTRVFQHERLEAQLTSVKQLRMSIENNCSMNLREILANLIFIACIDCQKCLVQHSTKLYLCDTIRLAEELFYETILYDFQNINLIRLSNPLPLHELLVLGLSSQQEEWDPALGDMQNMATQMMNLLISKKDMLSEYFSLEINENAELVSLPLLIDGHTPFMGALPTYLVRLVTEVNWLSEKECFETFSRQTAVFYAQPNPDTSEEATKNEFWTQEHVIIPAIRKYFLPPKSFVTNGAILQIASLSDLYKVFERC